MNATAPAALSPDEQVAVVTEWMLEVRRRCSLTSSPADEGGGGFDDVRRALLDRVAVGFVPRGEYLGPDEDADAVEVDEAALCQAVCERYGPVTAEDEERLRNHLDNLTTLLLEAARHGRDYWTSAERATHDRLPEEVFHGIQQDRLLLSSEEFRTECGVRLHGIVEDPLLDGAAVERVLGESQLRPRTVYPVPADV